MSYRGMSYRDIGYAPNTRTKCIHCKSDTETGTHGGCEKCGRVKYTTNGRRPRPEDAERAA